MVEITYEELKKKYVTAQTKLSEDKELVKNLKREHESCVEEAHNLVKRVKACVDRLREIALRPTLLTEVEYIDLLIDTEKREKREWWKERVDSYEILEKRQQMVEKIHRGQKAF